MPGIDLSSLSGTELRRLLKVARDRDDAALTQQLETELATRGVGGRPQAAPLPPVNPMAEEPSARMTWRSEPEPLYRPGDAPPPRPRNLSVAGLGLAAAGLVAAVVAWNVVGPDEPPVPAATPPAATAPRAMAALTQPVEPTAAPAPPAQPKPAARAPKPTPPKPARIARAEPAIKGPLRTTDPCSSPPTAADRIVCSDLAIAEMHREMREAYVRALNAHVDPYVVGPAQDAWRRARDPVSDPRRLAQLYDRRIRELNAATAAARAEQPPY